jgi:hypothetical protein
MSVYPMYEFRAVGVLQFLGQFVNLLQKSLRHLHVQFQHAPSPYHVVLNELLLSPQAGSEAVSSECEASPA